MTQEQRLCPLTSEPLPEYDQRAVISQRAQENFRYKCNNLADKVRQANLVLTCQRSNDSEIRTQPKSKPPLNLGLLDAIIDCENLLDYWARQLAATLGVHYLHGDWTAAQAIYRMADLVHHQAAVELIVDINRTLDQLNNIAEPPGIPKLYGAGLTQQFDRLMGSWLTISNASRAIEHYTGRPMPTDTIYSWIRRGKLDSQGDPHKVLVSDVLKLQEHGDHA